MLFVYFDRTKVPEYDQCFRAQVALAIEDETLSAVERETVSRIVPTKSY